MSSPPSAQDTWPKTIADARALQEKLRKLVRIKEFSVVPRVVAGVDVSVEQEVGRVFGVIVLMAWPSGRRLETKSAVGQGAFPYVPGYLSFREGPLLDAAFKRLQTPPDLVVCDGQGLAHPRRFGLACHLGVLWDIPSIGCAKSGLFGKGEEPGCRKGDWAPLVDGEEVLGSVLRTRDGVRPVFVSPGHQMDVESSRRLVLEMTTKYRLPEPIRWAHAEVNSLRRAWMTKHGAKKRSKNVE